MKPQTDGRRCCGVMTQWKDMDYWVATDGDGGLLFLFACPLCGDVLRSDPFAFPSDYEQKK